MKEGVVSYPNRMDGIRYITNVDCIAVEKRQQLNKQYVYVLLVSWSNNMKYPIYRKYPEFFDLKSQLKEEFPDKEDLLPELSAAKHFDRLWLFGFRDSNNEKKKRHIEEFCQKIIQLPFDVSRSITVLLFFEQWDSDSNQLPQTSSIFHHSLHDAKCSGNNGGSQTYLDSSAYVDVDDLDREKRVRCSSLDAPRGLYSYVSNTESLGLARSALRNTVHQRPQEDIPCETESNNLYRAICDHKSTRQGDVSLVKGAILEVQEKSLSGWWFVTGEKGEVQGWAPGAFLEPLVESSATNKSPMEQEGEGIYQAVADYKASSSDEVSYKTGDTVEVLETSLDGWWRVKCNGKTGFSPAINLEKINEQKKVNSGLFHKKSRRRKGLPPRKNSDGGKATSSVPQRGPVYAEVTKPKSKPAPLPKDANNNGSKPAGITYTEVTFDHGDTSSRPIITVQKEERVTYSDVVLPTTKQQGLTPSPVSSTSSSPCGPLSPIAQRLSPVLPRSPTRPRTPEQDVRKMYENYPLPNKVLPYENLDLPVSEVIPTKPQEQPGKPIVLDTVPDIASLRRLKLSKSMHSSSSQEDDSYNGGIPSEASILSARHKLCGQPWFVGAMSRLDAEKLLMSGKHQNFLIRESTNRIGDFTLSVQFEGRARHFPIKLTKDDKYFIGKHNFKEMSRVVQYYQAHPLFYDDQGNPVSLGSPLDIKH